MNSKIEVKHKNFPITNWNKLKRSNSSISSFKGKMFGFLTYIFPLFSRKNFPISNASRFNISLLQIQHEFLLFIVAVCWPYYTSFFFLKVYIVNSTICSFCFTFLWNEDSLFNCSLQYYLWLFMLTGMKNSISAFTITIHAVHGWAGKCGYDTSNSGGSIIWGNKTR